MKHTLLLTTLIAGVAALPGNAQTQRPTEGTVTFPASQTTPPAKQPAPPATQAAPPTEPTGSPVGSFLKEIGVALHLTHRERVDDSGLPIFHPRVAHHKHRDREAGPEHPPEETEAVAVPPGRVRIGADIVTLSREQYDALRDLAALAQPGQTANAADQTAYQTANPAIAYQAPVDQTVAANAVTTDSSADGKSTVPVLKVALPAAAAVTRLPNQAPSATRIPQLRRKMKREE